MMQYNSFVALLIIFRRIDSFFILEYDLCKLTNSGSEYVGKFAQTISNEPCQSWSASKPHCAEKFSDDSFPDGSKKLANNYCRNPDEYKEGPWCYPLNPKKGREPCKVPTCSNPKCRWTGIGLEYTGPLRVSSKQRECSPWSTDAKQFKELDRYNLSFPEGNRMLASRGCRNPTEDPGGPWCFVVASDGISENVVFQKEYCDVPFCFSPDGITVIDNHPGTFYTHFTEVFHYPTHSVDISFKLWAPGDWDVAELRIALSSLAVSATGEEMRQLAFGYEIIIKNKGATITRIGDEKEISIIEPGLINGLAWTNLTITRSSGSLYVMIAGSATPLMVLDLMETEGATIEREKIKYISHKSNVFTIMYIDYSVKRDGPFSVPEEEEREVEFEEFCPKHVTNSELFAKYFFLRKMNVGGRRDLNFNVRGFKVNIKLTVIPSSTSFPFIIVHISQTNFSVVLVHQCSKTVLANEEVTDMLTIWKWTYFEINLSGPRMQVSMRSNKEIKILHDMSEPLFAAVRWFAISSFGQAEWTFFCQPTNDKYLQPYPPECRTSTLGLEYMGRQSVTKEGYPCFPWISDQIQQILKDSEFPDGTVAGAVNYCRNPTAEPEGPYCYAREPSGKINKFTCNVQNCTFSDCRLAGTGDDYTGTTNVTRSNKTCKFWIEDLSHYVIRSNHSEGFPERSLKKAQNYCRNPNRDPGGPWCYTTDRELEKDLCSVPDCYEPETCTVIFRGQPNHRVFIDPQKRTFGIKFKAKIWNPSVQPELSFTFYPEAGNANITFVMGAQQQEFLQLYFYTSKGRRALLKQYAYPHLLSGGRWTSITLVAQKYHFEAIHTDTSVPFFTWKYSRFQKYYETLDEEGQIICIKPFSPMYFSYSGGQGKNDFIGLSFPCDDCHTELVRGPNLGGVVYYPMNLWTKGKSHFSQDSPKVELKIHLRGKGASSISFYGPLLNGMPTVQFQLNEITIDGVNRFSIFARKKKKLQKVYQGTIEGSMMYCDTGWTEFDVEICPSSGLLKREGQIIGYWNSSNTPMYFFTVEAWADDVLWTATCDPPDINCEFVHGGWSSWSPWTCSTSCGGGKGFRTRTCTNPQPSFYGKACRGDDIMVGSCNNFPCGRISPWTLELLKKELRTVDTQHIDIEEGLTVKIPCSPKRMKMIKTEEPSARIQWERNSEVLAPEVVLSCVDDRDYSLTVTNVTGESTGVYACMVHLADSSVLAVDITTVVVVTEWPIMKKVGESLVLQTNAEILGRVYGRLTVEWLHNHETYRLYDFDVDVDRNETIYSLMKEFEGTWECRVYQEPLGLRWTTNFLRVKVQVKPTISSRLLAAAVTNRLFIKLQKVSNIGMNKAIIYVVLAGLLYSCVHLLVKWLWKRRKSDTASCDDSTSLLDNQYSSMSYKSKVCSVRSDRGVTTTDVYATTTDRYSTA